MAAVSFPSLGTAVGTIFPCEREDAGTTVAPLVTAGSTDLLHHFRAFARHAKTLEFLVFCSLGQARSFPEPTYSPWLT